MDYKKEASQRQLEKQRKAAAAAASAAPKKAVEVEVAVKKVEGPIEEAKTEEEKKIFPILDAMGIEHVALACACEV